MAVTHLFRHAGYLDRHRPTETSPPMLVGHAIFPLISNP